MSRLNELLQQAGNIGRNEDGSITRLGFSEGYFQALELLKARMKEIGMQAEYGDLLVIEANIRGGMSLNEARLQK